MAQARTMGKILADFFGYRPYDTSKSNVSLTDVKALPYEQGVAVGGLKGFAVELGRLSDSEKLELAQMAAKELGLKAEDVEFPFN